MNENSCPFPLYGEDFKRDPYSTYARLRAEGDVHRVKFPSGVLGWLVVGYESARAALTDSRLGKDHSLGNEAWRRLAAIMPEPQHSLLQVHLLHRDPPQHAAMRKLVLNGLTPRRIEPMRPRFERIAHDLIDEVAPSGEADLVPAFSARFPFLVLSEAIGLPPRLRDLFDPEWCKVVRPVGPQDPLRDTYIALLEGLRHYIDGVVAHKRAHPEDDLLTDLVRASSAGEITEPELTSSIFQLLVAGQEPVSNQITTALVALLTHPDQLDLLVANPELREPAVEELMRYDSAFELTTWRFFSETTRLHDATIPAGDSVIVSLASANRDPAQFPDADRLDVTRAANGQLGFGHGIHYCAGAALGRMELQIALGAIIERLRNLRLTVPPDHLPWVQAVLGRGTQSLPVSFTPENARAHRQEVTH